MCNLNSRAGGNIPSIENLNGVIACSMENPKEMNKHCLPYPKLKLMHEIWNKHVIKVEAKF
jgi:hypothetical protein